jgi:tRNA A37 threonylcarbamoyladenosine biosynthesis protein TsaE
MSKRELGRQNNGGNMSVGKAITGASAWAWDQFGDTVKPGFLAFLKRKYKDAKEDHERLRYTEAKWKNFSWGQAAERYKKHMQEIYGHIRVIGTTEPIPIGDIFTDVYILKQPDAYRRFDFTKLHEIQEKPENLDDGERMRGLQVVISKNGHRLYILGKPGAGKTTFLKYLVHQTIVASELDKLPIFVTLRDWDSSNAKLMDFITSQFSICNFPDALPFIEYLLESGKAIVLFDGLDEVPQEFDQRGLTIRALHDFSKKYLEVQIIVTCRVAASDYSFTEFTYVEMADFSEKQVETYARNWFRNSSETADGFLKALNLTENKGVRDLSRSPLLLSMICLAYEETLNIPKRRVELYEEALDALLKKWDSSRKVKRDQTYKQLSIGHKRQMFAEIAADYFDKGEIFFQKKELTRKIETYLSHLPPDATSEAPDGETILETISAQHGMLVERARGIYSFSHLTFQEYYTAKYITENANRGTLERLAIHLNDSRWREIFLLTASLLSEATPLFEAMQAVAQQTLRNNPILLPIQAWAYKRATYIPAYKECAKRTLYWFIYLNLAIFDLNHDQFLDLARELDSNLVRYIARDLDRARDLDQNLALALVLARDRALYFIFYRNITQDSSYQARAGLKNLYFELNTLFLVSFANNFALLKHEERSKARIEQFQAYLSAWQAIPENPPGLQKTIVCPSVQASDRAWNEFKKTIYQAVEKLLEVDLSQKWEYADYEAASNYLQANQLFWDCLQVARVEDRAAVEDMILKAPEQ